MPTRPARDEAWPNGTPCWIDLMVTDTALARHFYSSLFGWDTLARPLDADGYLICMLKGCVVAAISPKPSDDPVPHVWSICLACDDLDATAAKAKAAGSQFMMEPMDVMTAGRRAFAMDPPGAPYGIWQAGGHEGVAVSNEPGTLVWNQLFTRDYEGPKAFYGDVFGFTYQEIGEGFAYSTVKRPGDGAVVASLGELGASVLRQRFDTPFGRMAPLIGAQGGTFSLIQAASEE